MERHQQKISKNLISRSWDVPWRWTHGLDEANSCALQLCKCAKKLNTCKSVCDTQILKVWKLQVTHISIYSSLKHWTPDSILLSVQPSTNSVHLSLFVVHSCEYTPTLKTGKVKHLYNFFFIQNILITLSPEVCGLKSFTNYLYLSHYFGNTHYSGLE